MEILYEDNHIIVAVKPAGVLSQSDGSGKPDMLNELKKYIKEEHNKPGNVFLGLVHRLDLPVEGVMVFAKTSKAASRLSEQIRNRTFDKRYRAVVAGTPNPKEGEIVSYIAKDKANNKALVSNEPKEGYKLCRLEYKVAETIQDKSLVDIKLDTGRTHQIRAQFAQTGHPLLGDVKYGSKDGLDFPALQSCSISFGHPTTKEQMTFELPMPDRKPWSDFI